MKRSIKIAVEGKTTLPLDSLEPFQEDIKTLSKERYELLRESIINNGISFVVHVWQKGGKNHIIDGHQRVFVLKQLVEIEGFEIKDIPVALVKAKTIEEAKIKVLAGASVYGEIDEKAFGKYLDSNNIDIALIFSQFSLPSIDVDKFSKDFLETQKDIILPDPEDFAKTMPSSSASVKQVQLLFNSGSHEQFIKYSEALAKKYGTENTTDTVLEVMGEAYRLVRQEP